MFRKICIILSFVMPISGFIIMGLLVFLVYPVINHGYTDKWFFQLNIYLTFATAYYLLICPVSAILSLVSLFIYKNCYMIVAIILNIACFITSFYFQGKFR